MKDKEELIKLQHRMEYHAIIFGTFRYHIFELEKDMLILTNDLKKVLDNNSDDIDSILKITDELKMCKNKYNTLKRLLVDLEYTSGEIRKNVDEIGDIYDIERIRKLNIHDIMGVLKEIVYKDIIDNKKERECGNDG